VDEIQIFYVAMLIPAVIVLGVATLPSTGQLKGRLDRESLLILATAPHSLGQIFKLAPLFFRIDFLWWPWFWFVFFSIAFVVCLKFAFVRWHPGGWRKQCKLAFSLLYFAVHWLLYAYAAFFGVPFL